MASTINTHAVELIRVIFLRHALDNPPPLGQIACLPADKEDLSRVIYTLREEFGEEFKALRKLNFLSEEYSPSLDDAFAQLRDRLVIVFDARSNTLQVPLVHNAEQVLTAELEAVFGKDTPHAERFEDLVRRFHKLIIKARGRNTRIRPPLIPIELRRIRP